ncbi:MAG: hypothetical protein ACLQVI_17730 [Polyangiaceae bacterium]
MVKPAGKGAGGKGLKREACEFIARLTPMHRADRACAPTGAAGRTPGILAPHR